ncbi:MAG: DUF1287 domain-containing protein [Erysipelotrichaceae bacterium]|nr:DUF1287 domain-containing protein [Erysipelotrichaceae bacterium]
MKKFFLLLLFLAAGFLIWHFRLFPQPYYTDADFGITTFVSGHDEDGDGIDDQLDILQSAKAYLATDPVYKSKYYETGYPDDQYGVCTDVVAFALLDSGYDLKQLVYEDVLAHREDYAIDVVDANIDFRRVRNLKVYFEHNWQSLSTDTKEIEAWQAGDIVTFRGHIGILSDRRDRSGMPYVLHHAGHLQLSFEEDILPYREDITGHYRLTGGGNAK